MDANVKALSDALIAEIFRAVGLSQTGWARRTFGPFFARATNRLADIGLTFDRLIATDGLCKAADWALSHWCKSIRARGTEKVPAEGPLLVVSNHPGTYDALAIITRLKREDLRIIAADIPFLMKLPRAHEHFFFVSQETYNRAHGLHAAIHHLQNGGAVLIYGSGHIDPDPAISKEAVEHIDLWSRSIDLFLRLVPETKVLLTIVSQAVSKGWSRSPITWLQCDSMAKRRLAEFGQVLQQLFFPGSLYLSPRLTFDTPLTVEMLHAQSGSDRFLPVLIDREKKLLAEHLAAAAMA